MTTGTRSADAPEVVVRRAGAADVQDVLDVAVAPAHQGRGVGRRLLRLAEEQAGTMGIAQVRLSTHEAMSENASCYPRRGCRQSHRAVQDGYRRVFFAKGPGAGSAGADRG
ncbi:acetyltransferase (GNAT) family protein [Kineococcus xinjiangensis]|uniref:Acetyltransferase (GNAT) family protein n=1 Tax=Kineococcus xinjiangensis TaxID=512762 RepID=A0A2S6ITE1_9ACTN|nr:GNAT family N-acetyltransferase [Kineococcus xinjiangensis]PPK97316.1 acetyltransferase (GNAT) family protein [Kineococcus xinjiangensis]